MHTHTYLGTITEAMDQMNWLGTVDRTIWPSWQSCSNLLSCIFFKMYWPNYKAQWLSGTIKQAKARSTALLCFLGADLKAERSSDSCPVSCSPILSPPPFCRISLVVHVVSVRLNRSGYGQQTLIWKTEPRSQYLLAPPFNLNMEGVWKLCTNCLPYAAKYTMRKNRKKEQVERTGSYLPHLSFLPGKTRYYTTLKETFFKILFPVFPYLC